MRLIAGSLGGRRLKSADCAGLRPAMARTREAIFSMLEARAVAWEGLRVLDLFAGSGSLAFECLSRGAAEAHLVENGAKAYECLTRNAADLSLWSRCRLWRLDVKRFLHKSPSSPFDLVFLDPPYRKNYAQPCLGALARPGWLAPGAFVVAELEKNARLRVPELLSPVAERAFGQTSLHIWKMT